MAFLIEYMAPLIECRVCWVYSMCAFMGYSMCAFMGYKDWIVWCVCALRVILWLRCIYFSDVGLFGWNVGLFLWSVGLFLCNIGLFSWNVGLFLLNVGLF